ncbi:MAG: sugar phosphate isomerase/epimerase family protein [Thermoleophilaceae bacterium]
MKVDAAAERDIFFSFFMFTADLRPADTSYTPVLIEHLRAVSELGYDGVDVHIASQPPTVDHGDEVESYVRLKETFDDAGLADVKFTTNVGSTRTFDPTSPYKEQRDQALAYLKSRVDITSVLGAGESIMTGPFLYPYGVFPLTDFDEAMWSDALQEWMRPRYLAAQPVLQELAEYASTKGVKLGIEPVKSWETPGPNSVSDVLDFLDGVESTQLGVMIDTAQVVMESQGPSTFRDNVARAAQQDRLHSVHISAPDRGAVHDSWILWDAILGEIDRVYDGPYLVEVFNAIPPFDASMRMGRRRFWRPGEDDRGADDQSAYEIGRVALETVREQLASLRGAAAR